MGNIRQWINNGRPIALAQSMMPAILAVVLALGSEGFHLWTGILAVLGVAAAHLAMNIADDYFDYRVDMLSDRERVIRQGFRAMTVKYPYLTDGSESLSSTRRAICAFAAFSLCCGLPIFLYRTITAGFCGVGGAWWLVAIVAATAFLGIFYSAPPLKLGYRGLGEVVIGLIFGPLLMMGCYYSAGGVMNTEIIWVSIPVGLLVLNILFTHSFIDMPGDEASNKMTLARLIGSKKHCLWASYFFSLSPFAMIVVAVCLGVLHPLYLIVLLMLPRALWLCRSLTEFYRGETEIPETPPRLLGNMGDWASYKAAGIDWFLIRWLAARNTLSGVCVLIMLVKIILLVI